MKLMKYFLTRDNVRHDSQEEAVQHCLEEAISKLAAVLDSVHISSSRHYAELIIGEAVENAELRPVYYALFDVVGFLKDTGVYENGN